MFQGIVSREHPEYIHMKIRGHASIHLEGYERYKGRHWTNTLRSRQGRRTSPALTSGSTKRFQTAMVTVKWVPSLILEKLPFLKISAANLALILPVTSFRVGKMRFYLNMTGFTRGTRPLI